MENKFISDFGWKIKTGVEQRFGSPADVYAEYENFRMIVDDGNCPNALNAVYHIYYIDGKVFEGRIETIAEFNTIMKVLNIKDVA